MNVGDLRRAIATLPDSAGILIEVNQTGHKYEVTRLWAIGQATDDPGLVIKVDWLYR